MNFKWLVSRDMNHLKPFKLFDREMQNVRYVNLDIIDTAVMDDRCLIDNNLHIQIYLK